MAQITKQYVSPGDYVIGLRKAKLLEAFLGTCVAVAIHDRDAGIGGLIHVLLAEPVCSTIPLNPLKYAATGLPLFISALYDKGARREAMQATIAGGSLLSPLSDDDLALDFGGHTAETVIHHLAREGIRIEKSETGGFLKYCLSLNMQNMASSIAVKGIEEITQSQNLPAVTFKDLQETIENLLPVPQVALKILRMLNEDSYEKCQITREISKDQVLSARTMQLCNSIAYKRRYQVESLDEALLTLGQNILSKLVMSVAIKNFINQCGMGYSLCKGGLFHHAVGTAVIAEKLAHFTGRAKPAVAYTAGLLHDIGKVILDQHIASLHPFFYRGLHVEKKSLLQVERNLFGTDHAEAGQYLAHKWLISEPLSEAIAHHHNPENATLAADLVHIIHLADLLMSGTHAGLAVSGPEMGDLQARLATIGLSVSQIPELVDLIPPEIFGSLPELALNASASSR